MNIKQIRCATSVIVFFDQKFLIDPMFAPKDFYPPIPMCATPDLRWPIADLPEICDEIIKGIDAVIMTHYHSDHFDEFAINILPKEIKVFVQDEFDRNVLEDFGFKNIEILKEEGNEFNGIKLYKTNCIHGIKETTMPYFEMVGIRHEAMGVVFEHKHEKTLYLAGDTIWCDYVKNAIDKFNPDVAVVNAADARLENSGSIIMGKKDIMELHRYAPNLKIIASHMDCVGHATLNRKQLGEFVEKEGIENFVMIPKDGEAIEI